jgi:hypothetical protein
MDTNDLMKLAKTEIPELAKKLTKADVAFLVEKLSEKDDVIRYNAFLLLQANSREFPYTCEHWNALEDKLENDNSYQRSLGLMLIAENVRWDRASKFDKAIGKYLGCCADEKFITARQAIQGLANVLDATDKYNNQIKQHLSKLQFSQYKENQQKLLTKDVANIIKQMDKKSPKPKKD